MEKTLLSVIICTLNRSDWLVKAIQSIDRQTIDDTFEFEVWIVDNSPTGCMKPAFDSATVGLKNAFQYTHQPKRGKSQALNWGIAQANGEILVFTDDDVIADENWLLNINHKFKDQRCDGIGGRVLPVYPENTPAWVKDNAVQLAGAVVIYDYGPNQFELSRDHYAFIGANFAFRKKIFDECGLFRTDLGPGTSVGCEDSEIVERFSKANKVLFYCGDVLIWHPVDLNRLKLRFLAHWHTTLGRYAAQREIENKVKISSYFLGIPRYLYRRLILDAIQIPLVAFHKMKLINVWRSYFRTFGMMQEYRRQGKGSPS